MGIYYEEDILNLIQIIDFLGVQWISRIKNTTAYLAVNGGRLVIHSYGIYINFLSKLN